MSTVVEKQDRSGVKYYVHEVDGVTYPDYEPWTDLDYRLLLDAVKNAKTKPNDVFVTGFPKSGNNWFYEITSMVLQQTASLVPTKLADEFLDWKTLDEMKSLTDTEDQVRFFSHFSPVLFPTMIPDSGTKVIYLVRNLKDVTVSAYKFISILIQFVPYKGTWEDFMEVFLSDEGFVYSSWFEHVRQADLFRERYPHVPFHILCFEKMKIDPVGEIQKLCKFLDKPDTLAAEIAEMVHFKKMRPTVMEGKFKEFTEYMCEKGSVGLFRKGEIGDWKNHFTVAQSELVDKMFEEKLGDSPIGQIVKPFM